MASRFWKFIEEFGEYVNMHGWCDPTTGMPLAPSRFERTGDAEVELLERMYRLESADGHVGSDPLG